MTHQEALNTNTIENWKKFWKQVRLQSVRYDRDVMDDPDNLLVIRYSETKDKDAIAQNDKVRRESVCFQAFVQVFPKQTDALIEQTTTEYFSAEAQVQEDFESYLQYKKNGDLEIQVIDQSTPLSFEGIRNASVEELFQTKLEIFESPPVQETDKKETRAKIRKSESIIEALYHYYIIVNDIDDESDDSPDNIDTLLDISSEQLFKYKLQIFEKEEVQNSENREARSKIRKAENMVDMLIGYNEILNES